MSLTPSQLRADVYRVLDEVLATGVPAEVLRNGRILRIVADPSPVPRGSKIENLCPHPGFVIGDPDDLVHIDWSVEWRP